MEQAIYPSSGAQASQISAGLGAMLSIFESSSGTGFSSGGEILT